MSGLDVSDVSQKSLGLSQIIASNFCTEVVMIVVIVVTKAHVLTYVKLNVKYLSPPVGKCQILWDAIICSRAMLYSYAIANSPFAIVLASRTRWNKNKLWHVIVPSDTREFTQKQDVLCLYFIENSFSKRLVICLSSSFKIQN